MTWLYHTPFDFSENYNRQVWKNWANENAGGNIGEPVDAEIDTGKRHEENQKNADSVE